MLLILALIFFFLIPPLTAWAYFDPGFGGYFINTVISLIVTGFAFISAAVIYFFRTIIGQRFILLWQKYEKLCLILLLFVLGVGSFFLGTSLHRVYHKLSTHHSYLRGAHIIDPQRMFKGYNLNNGELMDEKGRIVKKWSSTALGRIDKNGDYYGQHYEDAPLWGRYTWDDHVIWEKHFILYHELYLSPEGTIFVFSREPHHYNDFKVDFDVILEFDKNGNQLQRYSFWDHLKEFQPYHAEFGIDPHYFWGHPFALPWKNLAIHFDYFHLNSFFILPPNPLEEKNPAFRHGNWLISIFHGSMVFILDQDTKKILWHAVADEIEGGLQGQHSASMLPDGNILLFDNGMRRDASRILIIDPLTLKIKWQYSNKDFFSRRQGFVQALPNGNFLITESNKSHVFELTPDKEIVWEYYYPDDNYRMTRYPKDMIDHLLGKDGAP